MSLGWYLYTAALMATLIASLDIGAVGDVRLERQAAFELPETSYVRGEGYTLTSQTIHWEQITVSQSRIIAGRMHQLMDELSSPATLSVSDLGISNLNSLPGYFTMEVNGAGGGSLRIELPAGADPESFAQLLNLHIGNQFAGYFDGTDIVSDEGYILTLPSGLSSPSIGEVVVVIQ